jgi:hypothetical protein
LQKALGPIPKVDRHLAGRAIKELKPSRLEEEWDLLDYGSDEDDVESDAS